MQPTPAAVRQTIFALLSAAEIDLRTNIIRYVLVSATSVDVYPSELLERLRERAGRAGQESPDKLSDADLLQFLDFADPFEIFNRHKNYVSQDVIKDVESLDKRVPQLVQVRNRVMHSRPLEPDDFALTYDFSLEAAKQKALEWTELRSTMKRLIEEPSYVLKLKIPEIPWDTPSPIPHNLPLPEFDDTGFIGRSKDRADITKLILSHHQIVTILGEGGVGKTAILVKCLYDILDTASDKFEAIVWVSLKNLVLTSGGVQYLRNNLTNALGLAQAIAKPLGAVRKDSLAEALAELREYLSEFRVLLAIDNLETLQGEEIMDFFRDLPPNSKLVITSRIGLGELEIRRPLQAMDDKEASQLFRRFAQVHAVESLLRMPNPDVIGLCRKLYRNPLIIRWYITSVQLGMPFHVPSEKQSEVLEFCVRNVYDRLSPETRYLLKIFLAARKPLGEAELAYISQMEALDVRRSIYEITSTMMIKAEQKKTSDGSIETQYSLTEIARKYLEIHHPPDTEQLVKVTRTLTELSSAVEEAEIYRDQNPYDPRAIIIRSPNDRVAARLLQKALLHSRKKDHVEGLSYIEQAKEYAPTYSEVYKISAFIKTQEGDYFGAQQDYEQALELSDQSPQLLFFYAGFLNRYLKDSQRSLEVVEKAAKLDPENKDIAALKGRVLTFLGRYRESWDVFETVINDMDEHTLIFRIKTYGMALDCLRRWVEQLSSRRETKAAWAVALSAFPHFQEAFKLDGRDKYFIDTLSELIMDVNKCIRINNDKESIKLIVDLIYEHEVQLSLFPEFYKLLKIVSWTCRTIRADESTTAKMARLLERYGIDPSSGIMDGKVVRLFPDKGFGFIHSEDDGSDYYFKLSDIPLSHRKNVRLGSRFQFAVGRNASGLCAMAIEPLDNIKRKSGR